MVMDADKYGVRPTKEDDDRITHIGKFTRRFIPQLRCECNPKIIHNMLKYSFKCL